MKKAPLLLRSVAFMLDLGFLFFVCLLLFLSGLAGYVSGAGPSRSFPGFLLKLREFLPVFFFFSSFLFLFYFTYLNAHGESTIGKGLFRIKVVRRKDGEPISLGRSFLRAVFYCISAFPFFAGFFLAFLLNGRSLHDMLAGTMVVREM